jgi:hypothetical protein
MADRGAFPTGAPENRSRIFFADRFGASGYWEGIEPRRWQEKRLRVLFFGSLVSEGAASDP